MTMRLRAASAVVGGTLLAAAAHAVAVQKLLSDTGGKSQSESQAHERSQPSHPFVPQGLTFYSHGDHFRMREKQSSAENPTSTNLRSHIEMTVSKLNLYKGRGTPASRLVYATVSTFGVMGMFSAIVGAMLGVWLDEACDDADDDDGFAYWDDGEWDTEGDLGWEREDHYSGMREVGCLLYSSL